MELVTELLQCGLTNTFTMKKEKGRKERERMAFGWVCHTFK
jgi:hypothetical protein